MDAAAACFSFSCALRAQVNTPTAMHARFRELCRSRRHTLDAEKEAFSFSLYYYDDGAIIWATACFSSPAQIGFIGVERKHARLRRHHTY